MAYLMYLSGVTVIFSNSAFIRGDFPLCTAFPREEAQCTLLFTVGCTAAHSPALENMLNAIFS